MRITYFTYVLRTTQGGRHDDALGPGGSGVTEPRGIANTDS
jgi:hypothetical protein